MKTKRALVCAPKLPEFDHEGGSRRIFHLIELFRQAGWAVSFIAQNGIGGERYARTLQQMGVATYVSRDPWSDGNEALINPNLLIATGHFDLALIAFWYHAEDYLPIIRSLSPETRVVVDSIDLNFLRQSRSIFCKPNGNESSGMLDAHYAQEMMRELNVYAAADAVLTVSQKEAELINDFVNDPSSAYSLPDMEEIEASTLPFAERKGMLFIGNFRHPPNEQAVEYLYKDVLPRLKPDILAEHPVYIIGTGLNKTVINYASGLKNVLMLGWVPSVIPYLQCARISLIPLLYGAGTKRKLMQSMVVGTPSVSTSIGIEGFDLQDGLHVLVADDPSTFATSITRLLTDEELWHRLVLEGRNHILEEHSREAVATRFAAIISQITRKPVKRSRLAGTRTAS